MLLILLSWTRILQFLAHTANRYIKRARGLGCEKLIQAPVPAQIIDKGIPTAGLLQTYPDPQQLIQAPVPAQIIDAGIPTAGLLAQVLIGKYLDHMPLYRQESIFERAGLALPRSTLAQWVGACGVALQPLVDALQAILLKRAVLHADETPVPMLKPGLGRTHRAYLWSYSSSEYDEFPCRDLRL